MRASEERKKPDSGLIRVLKFTHKIFFCKYYSVDNLARRRSSPLETLTLHLRICICRDYICCVYVVRYTLFYTKIVFNSILFHIK